MTNKFYFSKRLSIGLSYMNKFSFLELIGSGNYVDVLN